MTPPAILVADDDDDVREMVSAVLASRGYTLLQASSGREALDRLRQAERKPELILLDLMMREMDGAQFLAEQRRDPTLSAIPVVIMTAAGAEPRAGASLPVAAWLYKPVKLAQLLATAAEYCGRGSVPGADFVPGADRRAAFLARRRDELPVVRLALARGDHAALRGIGHNLKGVAASYGCPALGVLGAELERAAGAADFSAERAVVERMAHQLAPPLD